MKANSVYLDTGIFIAFLDRSDAYHAEAVRLFAHPPKRWRTSLAVVSETYGWFLDWLGEEAARTFRVALADFSGLELIALDGRLHEEARKKLEQLRGHKLTYVDACSLVLLERLKIREVWATDRDLALEGANVAPA